MSVFEHAFFDEHELVHFVDDRRSGLKAIIAVHSTVLGPGIGGCRIRDYADSGEALADVLQLSRGMSFKCAMARLPMGGGKAVILADPSDKTPEMMRAFGRAVNLLGGRYVTAEDVGSSVTDMQYVAQETPYVGGLPHDDQAGGDPSPHTALGVYLGIREAAGRCLGCEDLKDLRVMVQGVGHVGYHLCQLLTNAGAYVLVSDVRDEHLSRVAQAMCVEIVDPDLVYDCPVDVFAPCALGGVINEATLSRLSCRVIAGAANNQLAHPALGKALMDRGILYAPDYVINAGGVINVWCERRGLGVKESCERIKGIARTLRGVFETAQLSGVSTSQIADEMARDIIEEARLAG